MAAANNYYTLPDGQDIDLRKVEEVDTQHDGIYSIMFSSGHTETIRVSDVSRATFITAWKAAD